MLKLNDIVDVTEATGNAGTLIEMKSEEMLRARARRDARMMQPINFQEFKYIHRVEPGSALETLADNVDLLLEHTEEIAARPEMAENMEVRVQAPLGRILDLGDIVRVWRLEQKGWVRVSTEGHKLYTILFDGSPLSGGCYLYRVMDPVTKMTGSPDVRPSTLDAYRVNMTIERAERRPWKEIPHPPAVKHESSFAKWERETKKRMYTVAEVTPRYIIPPVMTLAEIVAYFKR